MRRILLIIGFLYSGVSFGADWVLVTQSENNNMNHFIDKDYYKYDPKTNRAEVWEQAKTYKGTTLEQYVSSKNLTSYDCIGKRHKTLAIIKYSSDGSVIFSRSEPAKSYDVIFPDTVGESYWLAACKNKGKSLYLPFVQDFVNMDRIKGNLREYEPEIVPEHLIPKQ